MREKQRNRSCESEARESAIFLQREGESEAWDEGMPQCVCQEEEARM